MNLEVTWQYPDYQYVGCLTSTSWCVLNFAANHPTYWIEWQRALATILLFLKSGQNLAQGKIWLISEHLQSSWELTHKFSPSSPSVLENIKHQKTIKSRLNKRSVKMKVTTSDPKFTSVSEIFVYLNLTCSSLETYCFSVLPLTLSSLFLMHHPQLHTKKYCPIRLIFGSTWAAVLGIENNYFLKPSHTCSGIHSVCFYIWGIREYPIVLKCFLILLSSSANLNLEKSRKRSVRAERLKDRRNVTKMFHGQKWLKTKIRENLCLLQAFEKKKHIHSQQNKQDLKSEFRNRRNMFQQTVRDYIK